MLFSVGPTESSKRPSRIYISDPVLFVSTESYQRSSHKFTDSPIKNHKLSFLSSYLYNRMIYWSKDSGALLNSKPQHDPFGDWTKPSCSWIVKGLQSPCSNCSDGQIVTVRVRNPWCNYHKNVQSWRWAHAWFTSCYYRRIRQVRLSTLDIPLFLYYPNTYKLSSVSRASCLFNHKGQTVSRLQDILLKSALEKTLPQTFQKQPSQW